MPTRAPAASRCDPPRRHRRRHHGGLRCTGGPDARLGCHHPRPWHAGWRTGSELRQWLLAKPAQRHSAGIAGTVAQAAQFHCRSVGAARHPMALPSQGGALAGSLSGGGVDRGPGAAHRARPAPAAGGCAGASPRVGTQGQCRTPDPTHRLAVHMGRPRRLRGRGAGLAGPRRCGLHLARIG